MIGVLAVVAPVFAVIAAGYLAARLGLVPAAVEKITSRAVFGVAIPTLLFRTMINVSAPEASPWGLWGAYFGGVAVAWTVAFAGARRGLGKGYTDAAMGALGAGYSNTVLIGIPLVFSFFGEAQSAVPLFIILSVNLPVMLILGTLSIELNAPERAMGAAGLLRQVVKGLAFSPVVIGLVSGLAFRQTGFGIAAPLQWVIDLIALVAAPAALFTMGVALNRFGFGGQLGMCALVLPAKLVLHPLAVAALATWVFDLPAVWTGVAVLFAAAPTGINVFLLASRYDVAVPATTSAITIGAALSVVTVTLISWGLGIQAA